MSNTVKLPAHFIDSHIRSAIPSIISVFFLASLFVFPLPVTVILCVSALLVIFAVNTQARLSILFLLLPLSRTGFGLIPDHPGFGVFDIYALVFMGLFLFSLVSPVSSNIRYAFPLALFPVMLISFLPGLITVISTTKTLNNGVFLLNNAFLMFAVYSLIYKTSPFKSHGLIWLNAAASALFALYGLYLTASPSSIFQTLINRNTNELTGDPNYYAGYLIMIISHIFGLLLTTKRFALRIALIIMLAVLLVATMLTVSRAGYITLIAVLLAYFVYLYYNFNLRRLLSILASVILLSLATLYFSTNIATKFVNLFSMSERIESAVTGEDGSFKQRLKILTVASRIIEDNPVIGVGYGNFEPVFNKYRLGYFSTGDSRVAHNTFATILAENGLIGFAGASVFFVSIFLFLLKAYRTTAEQRHKPILFSLGLSLFSFMLMSVTLEQMYESYFWVFLGYALAFAVKVSQSSLSTASASSNG